jgi:Na+-transporting NADH:ubiquinone oxidoreductase subunit A
VTVVFAGPHPAGNAGTHIHHLDPVRKGETVWHVNAEDAARIGDLFLQGRPNFERTVAVTGEGAAQRRYFRTVIGVPARPLLAAGLSDGSRVLSGSILRGTDIGPDGYLCFYDQQLTALPAGGERKFLGWIRPGWGAYSFTRTFLSALRKRGAVSLDTDLHGSPRAIVLNHLYDRYVALDVMTYFLLRAVIAGDLEEAERLGILECAPEDFALCSFACPSKTDVGGIIRQGLAQIEAEG